MLTSQMEKAYNDQIQAEMYSAYMYLSMSSYFDSINLPGFASWFRVQYQEEVYHALKFYDYVTERGGRVRLGSINAPPGDWDAPVEAFQAALGHERMVTGLINELMNLAIEVHDHASRSFLQWYVDEQVEEEASAEAIIQQLTMVNGEGAGMLFLDKELGARVFTPPANG
jgi:ferritin